MLYIYYITYILYIYYNISHNGKTFVTNSQRADIIKLKFKQFNVYIG